MKQYREERPPTKVNARKGEIGWSQVLEHKALGWGPKTLLNQKNLTFLGVVTHAYNPSTQEPKRETHLAEKPKAA